MEKGNKYSSAYLIQKLKYRIKYMEYLIQGISMFGTEKFNDELNELGVFKQLKNEPYSNKDRDKKVFFDNKRDERVIDIVVDVVLKEWKPLNIDRNQLFNSVNRSENIKAKKMAMMLIKRNTALSDTIIGQYFNRSRQVLFNFTKEHKRDMKNKKSDYVKTFNKLNEIVSKKADKIK